MPTLGENARKYYIDAYGLAAYDRYRNDNGVDTIHGSKYTHSMVVQRKFVHRPDHDVESIFWVLYLVLLTVRPAVPSKDWRDGRNKQALGYFEDHVVAMGVRCDSRDPLLANNDLALCASLEPKLAFLGLMLYEMGCHIAPEYAYVDEEPPKDHLHEVMRRLLLRYIVEMKDPIPLDANVALSPKTPATGGSGAGRGGSKKAMSILEEQRMSMRRLSVVEKGSKASRVDSQPEDTSQEAGGSRSNNGGSKRGGKSQSNTRIPQRGRKATQTKRRG